MSDGDGPPPGEQDDTPLGALPAAPRPASEGSGWRINWWGLLPLSIVAALAFAGFRMIGIGGDGAAGAAVPTSSSVTSRPATTQRARPTTTTTTTTTTTPPITPAPTTTIAVPAVHAFGEIEPCRFGDACLVVSFTISGFAEPLPTAFRCIYPNSERQFSFNGAGKDAACLTGDEGDTVHIEVDGVRSAPISATNLNP